MFTNARNSWHCSLPLKMLYWIIHVFLSSYSIYNIHIFFAFFRLFFSHFLILCYITWYEFTVSWKLHRPTALFFSFFLNVYKNKLQKEQWSRFRPSELSVSSFSISNWLAFLPFAFCYGLKEPIINWIDDKCDW